MLTLDLTCKALNYDELIGCELSQVQLCQVECSEGSLGVDLLRFIILCGIE